MGPGLSTGTWSQNKWFTCNHESTIPQGHGQRLRDLAGLTANWKALRRIVMAADNTFLKLPNRIHVGQNHQCSRIRASIRNGLGKIFDCRFALNDSDAGRAA